MDAAGYHIVTRDSRGNILPTTLPYSFDGTMDGAKPRAEITDFWAMVFNPSSMSRLTHVLLGCFILGAFVVMSVCAYYLLRGRHVEFARRRLPLALVFATAASWGQLLAGHWSAKVAAAHQPAKLAAFEGLYRTEARAPAYLFGVPDAATESVRWGVAVPGLLSFLVHEDFEKPVTGLDAFPAEDRPPVQVPFQMYHLMVGLGMFFIGFTTLASFLHWRGRLFDSRWLLRLMVPAVVLPYVANQAGWIAAAVGRQPWIVYGELRTTEGVSRNLAAGNVVFSLVLFTLIYALLFAMFLYLLDRKIKHGPDEPSQGVGEGRPSPLIEAAGVRTPGGSRLTSGEVPLPGEA